MGEENEVMFSVENMLTLKCLCSTEREVRCLCKYGCRHLRGQSLNYRVLGESYVSREEYETCMDGVSQRRKGGD